MRLKQLQYEFDSTLHYFAVINDKSKFNDCGINDIDIHYNSMEYSRTILNSRSKISVEKQFEDSERNPVDYYTGEYRFGIYDSKPTATSSPMQILTVIYSESGSISYKLNGMPISSPDFTCAEPEMAYYVYDLTVAADPLMRIPM